MGSRGIARRSLIREKFFFMAMNFTTQMRLTSIIKHLCSETNGQNTKEKYLFLDGVPGPPASEGLVIRLVPENN